MKPVSENLASKAVTALKGVGPKSAERLARLGIQSVQDVLFHLPLRYQDRTRIQAIGSLRVGDQAVVDVRVDHADIRFGRRRSLLVQVSDGTGSLLLRFFHFSAAQKNKLSRGSRLRCFGEVRKGLKHLELVHPEYDCIAEEDDISLDQSLTPIYPTTEGMHQLSWRDLTEKALQVLNEDGALDELLPEVLLQRYQLSPLKDAVIMLHRPPAEASMQLLSESGHPAQQRLAFEELLAHQLSMRLIRAQQHKQKAPSIGLIQGNSLPLQLQTRLSFDLTSAQQRVTDQIFLDMQQSFPMTRLVQGDVGCGKTIVAALAALAAIQAGYQVALMAPTELLADQHRKNFEQWLTPLDISVTWLSGRQKGKAREAILEGLKDGSSAFVVGTHALFQEDVVFKDLGLVVVDEQHRFGVHQRLALRQKGRSLVPHQLIMTATPIPRTLAMTAYADLDLSVIDELPPGRTPVTTVVIPEQRREEIVQRVAKACASGKQAYWVCTLIEESESLQCQAAEDTAIHLAEALSHLKVGLVHGRLKAVEKASMMESFKQGEIDLLVATTVIEVGVDVPNASLMIIENAERLGLSQLHQLRGRVGRGSQQSHCVLMYRNPLGRVAKQRLAIMRDTNDGFVIAQKDLEIRGPGEVLGTRQTGDITFCIADLVRDQTMVPVVQELADELLEQAPTVVDGLIQRWIKTKENYASV